MSGYPNQLPGGPGAAAPVSEPDPVVEADELALAKIGSMCSVAKTSAEAVAQAIHTDMTRVNRLRFTSAKRMSLELARTISEASCRDAALRHIIELCMTANDMETSRILVQGIQSEPIREEIFLAYPALFR
jgi:predicted DNA binding protein